MNTKDVGERSEAMVIAKFMQAGFVVLTPLGDNQRYDFAIDEDGVFTRIQVKTAKMFDNSYIRAHTCSSSYHRGGTKKLYKGEADLFALYCPTNDSIYIVPVNAVGFDVALRISATKNNQMKSVRLAKDFTFESWVAQR